MDKMYDESNKPMNEKLKKFRQKLLFELNKT